MVTAAGVPGPGDPDGSGAANVTLNLGQEEVCFHIVVADITLPATGAHIHRVVHVPFNGHLTKTATWRSWMQLHGGAMARILVIEDDHHTRALLRQALELAGYTVLEAADGREGLRRQRASPAHLVITDIFMPEQEGLETIMALRRESPDVKIIAISGGGRLGRLDFLDVAARLGAQRTFYKPFDYQELLATVRELLQDT